MATGTVKPGRLGDRLSAPGAFAAARTPSTTRRNVAGRVGGTIARWIGHAALLTRFGGRPPTRADEFPAAAGATDRELVRLALSSRRRSFDGARSAVSLAVRYGGPLPRP